MLRYILIIALCVFSLMGCTKGNADSKTTINTKNIELLSREKLSNDDDFLIIKEKTTGKRFIVYKGYSKGGIVALD